MVKSLTISELAEQCQSAVRRYQQSGQSDEIYCFELFRRALLEQDEAAWQAIHSQYQTLVIFWVRNYSRFSQTGEEADFFVNGAFARLWQSGSKAETAAKLDSLGKCLRYLKLCVWSTIEDYLRTRAGDALEKSIPLEDYDWPSPEAETHGEHRLSLSELRQTLWETVQDNREHVAAEESWVYGFTPQQIQQRHSEIFATAEEVSQTKKNILKRLRRRLGAERRD